MLYTKGCNARKRRMDPFARSGMISATAVGVSGKLVIRKGSHVSQEVRSLDYVYSQDGIAGLLGGRAVLIIK